MIFPKLMFTDGLHLFAVIPIAILLKFKTKIMKLTDENLLNVLKQNRTREQLVIEFQTSDRYIRQRIAALIEKGHAIKSFNSEAGYRLLDPRIAEDRKAIELTVRDLKAKAKTTMQRAEAIQNRYQLNLDFISNMTKVSI